MTPEQDADLFALQHQAAELELRAAEIRLLTAEAEYRTATEHRPIPRAGNIRLQPPGYETKESACR